MKGNAMTQQAKGTPTVLTLAAELRAQGWRVEHGNQKWSAFPPDRSQAPVYFRNLENGREMRNVLSWLRQAGFVWHETDEERALGPADAAPVSASVPKPFIVPDAWSQPKTPELNPPPSAAPMTIEVALREERLRTYREELTFGQALEAERQLAKGDRATLAALVGVTDAAVWAWETGASNPITDHYDKLLEIFLDLAHAKSPDSRDIDKPKGRTVGIPNAPSSRPTVAPPVTETKLITLPEEPMNQPKPVLAVATHALIDKATLVRLIKLGISAQHEECEATKTLLREARDAHLTITDVLEILES